MSENNILGVILAGGKSKRFGDDKTVAKLGSKTLLDHTIEKIEKKFQEILIKNNKKAPMTIRVHPSIQRDDYQKQLQEINIIE